MTSQDHSPARDAPPLRDASDAVRSTLSGRRGLLVLAAVVLVAGLAMNWSWLVAAGIAPILVALAPCAVMCAAGFCMSRMTGQSCAQETTSQKTAEPGVDETRPIPSEAVAGGPTIQPSQTQDERSVTHA
jgi:hypothetical protein